MKTKLKNIILGASLVVSVGTSVALLSAKAVNNKNNTENQNIVPIKRTGLSFNLAELELNVKDEILKTKYASDFSDSYPRLFKNDVSAFYELKYKNYWENQFKLKDTNDFTDKNFSLITKKLRNINELYLDYNVTFYSYANDFTGELFLKIILVDKEDQKLYNDKKLESSKIRRFEHLYKVSGFKKLEKEENSNYYKFYPHSGSISKIKIKDYIKSYETVEKFKQTISDSYKSEKAQTLNSLLLDAVKYTNSTNVDYSSVRLQLNVNENDPDLVSLNIPVYSKVYEANEEELSKINEKVNVANNIQVEMFYLDFLYANEIYDLLTVTQKDGSHIYGLTIDEISKGYDEQTMNYNNLKIDVVKTPGTSDEKHKENQAKLEKLLEKFDIQFYPPVRNVETNCLEIQYKLIPHRTLFNKENSLIEFDFTSKFITPSNTNDKKGFSLESFKTESNSDENNTNSEENDNSQE
ncbi:hypothetical protein FRW55_02790 [Mycoplasma anserisalpingitidis]|uniref:Uncharacterized protein n=1 Tax=Mycoplasma anserisalpingitidis TaxID=519450 RepID=A0A5B8JXR5_9MOLU|nr:hypothetical protein [Mycoplasma anserisalpingitidis]QDY87069.1 hypothetical protein FRW55_02790 [Mycoplasma anserisalpingitidis]